MCHLLFGFDIADAKIVYTFDVYWEESDISWASRWDAYLNMPGGRVHWFSILNSLMVVLVMSSIVAMIMMRTIRRDLQRYEGLLGDAGMALPLIVPQTLLLPRDCVRSKAAVSFRLYASHATVNAVVQLHHKLVMAALAAGNDLEESGWKMVSGDVFRPPKNAIHLCVQIGSGVQIITSAFATLFFAALGECPSSKAASNQCSVQAACCSLSCHHLYFITSTLSLQLLACLHSLPVITSEFVLPCTAGVPYQAGTNV